MKDFKGKVAVITGAGRGIGRGIAERCVQEGMKVVLAGIGMESLSKTEAAFLWRINFQTVVMARMVTGSTWTTPRLTERGVF